MSGQWDKSFKQLIHLAPQDFDTLVVPGAVLEEELATEMVSREMRMDALHKVCLNGERMLLHLEFQKKRDPEMAERLLEYNVNAMLKFKLPVWSCVLYIDRVATPATALVSARPDGLQALRFDFQVINVRDLSVDDLLKTGQVGLYPLLPLTRDGKRTEVVEQMITELVAHENRDLLGFAYLFSALTFRDQDNRAWLKRRFSMFEDILEESWAYQELIERGVQKGLQEGLQKGLQRGQKKGLQEGLQKGLQKGQKKGQQQGLQEGLQKGQQQGLAQAVLVIVETHFPALLPQANVWVERVHDPAILQHLIVLLSLAKSVEEAEHILNSGTSATS